MFHLVYHIEFEVAAFLFAALLCIETYLHYPRQTRKNRLFRAMALMVLLTDAFDLLSAVTNTYAATLPASVNLLVNTGYFASGLMLCYQLQTYIEKAILPAGSRSVLLRFNRALLIVLELSMAPNFIFGYYFSFTAQGVYTHGALFLLLHAASMWFVLCGSAALIVNRRLLKRSQISSSFLFIGLYFLAVFLQTFVWPDVLLIMPAVTALLIITTFQLESPDYVQLQDTLRELTRTQQQLETINRQYYALAYTDKMTGLQNRSAYSVQLERQEGAAADVNACLLIADINTLKLLNDSYGHHIGDEAIIQAAQLLSEAFPAPCECYRIGGDEFAVIAFNVAEADFQESLRRFNEAVQARNLRLPYPFFVATGCSHTGELSFTDALRLADERMYEDKQRIKAEEVNE